MSSTDRSSPSVSRRVLTKWPEAALVTLIAHAAASPKTFSWSKTWLLSGAAELSYILLASSYRDGTQRLLAWAPISVVLALINLTEAASATSWLFYWTFTAACWPLVFLAALYQYEFIANATRKSCRKILHFVHFAADSIALFDLPALEIDTEVAGLMVIRGITLSLSSLTLVAHGIEVGIKLSDDLELALQTDKVVVQLFRRINIGDVYGNVKGGEFEQTFAQLEGDTRSPDGQPLMDEDRPLLRAATKAMEEISQDDNFQSPPGEQPPFLPPRPNGSIEEASSPNKSTMAEKMTDGRPPKDANTLEQSVGNARTVVGDDKDAVSQMKSLEKEIFNSSEIQKADRLVRKIVKRRLQEDEDATHVDLDNDRHVRASICSQLHRIPSIQHAPKQSIRVTTLQQLAPEWLLKLLHRMPLLLRLLLNPLAYFHPINMDSITVGASGRWVESLLNAEVFKHYADRSAEVAKLRDRLYEWLSEANFVIGVEAFKGQGLVPIDTDNDIVNRMSIEALTVYRTVPKAADLKKAIQLGGADAAVLVPSMLLPHHDHLLPSKEERNRREGVQRERIQRHDSVPKVEQEKRNLQQSIKDETNVQISVHVRLPAVLDQELLNFISALVKATKIIEFERTFEQVVEKEVRSFKDFTKLVNTGIRESVKKATVSAAANDQWIAKTVGKITQKLQTAHGDVGYSGALPVPLKIYREAAVPGESKLLP